MLLQSNKFSFELPGSEIPYKFKDIEDLNSRAQVSWIITTNVHHMDVHFRASTQFIYGAERQHPILNAIHINISIHAHLHPSSSSHRHPQITSQSTNSPFALELNIWENNSFITDEEIERRVRGFIQLYPPDRQFVLKVRNSKSPLHVPNPKSHRNVNVTPVRSWEDCVMTWRLSMPRRYMSRLF